MREFLERNKIFFEIFVSILLGVMAIIVSYQANLIAEAQLRLASESQQLSKRQYLPEIKTDIKIIDLDGERINEQLVIYNFGDDLYNIRPNMIAFLSFRETPLVWGSKSSRLRLKLRKATIPISKYFSGDEHHYNPNKGRMVSVDIPKTDFLDAQLIRFRESNISEKKRVENRIERFINVKYNDKFGEAHSKYFEIGVVGDAIPMSESEGAKKFREHSAMRSAGHFVDLTSSTSDEINNLWAMYRK